MKPANNLNSIHVTSLSERKYKNIQASCRELEAVRLPRGNDSVVISTVSLKNCSYGYGLILTWVISSHCINLPRHILNYSIMTPVVEVRPIPSRVALNMKALSSRHTVNHPPHHIVSQPTTPRCKCTRLLKLLRQNHVMCHRREKLNVSIHYSRKNRFNVRTGCFVSEIQLRYKHFNEPHKKCKYAKTNV